MNTNRDLFDSAAETGDVSEEDIIQFKSSYSLLDDTELIYQEITSSNTLSYEGKEIALDDIQTQAQIFTDRATYKHNGIPGNLPTINIYQKDDDGETVTVVKNLEDEVQLVTIFNKASNKTVELSRISPENPRTFATIKEEDYDFETLNNKFFFDSDDQNDQERKENSERQLFHRVDEQRQTEMATCRSYLVLEVAVAYESSFCRTYGGIEGADLKAASVVVETSIKYQNRLCIKLEISHLEGYCDSKSDPYQEFVNIGLSGCGNDGLIDRVREYWNNNRSDIHRDVMHLFTGTSLEKTSEGEVVGCAYGNTICQTQNAYGVDYISYTSSPNLQATLFAHELGHNSGGRHYEEKNGYIMNPEINVAQNGFSEVSLYDIDRYYNSVQCLEEEFPSTKPPNSPPLDENENGKIIVLTCQFFVTKVSTPDTPENKERIPNVFEDAIVATISNPNLTVEAKDFVFDLDEDKNRYLITFKAYQTPICFNDCDNKSRDIKDQIEDIIKNSFEQNLDEAADVNEVRHLFKNAEVDKSSIVTTDLATIDAPEAPTSSPTSRMLQPILPPIECRNSAKLLVNKIISIFI